MQALQIFENFLSPLGFLKSESLQIKLFLIGHDFVSTTLMPSFRHIPYLDTANEKTLLTAIKKMKSQW